MNSLKLKSARVALGIGQHEMAIQLGMTMKSYNEKENKKQKFWLHEVVSIALVLNLSPEQVINIFFEELLTNSISNSQK